MRMELLQAGRSLTGVIKQDLEVVKKHLGQVLGQDDNWQHVSGSFPKPGLWE